MSTPTTYELFEASPDGLTGVIQTIAHGIIERHDNIVLARRQKGGWEGWIQVELATYIQKLHGLQYDVLREQLIYGGSERVDIWAEPAKGQTGPYIGIELKVESEYQVGTGKTLKERFTKDIEKVAKGPLSTYKGAPGTELYAVGITSLKSDLVEYDTIAKATKTRIAFAPLVLDTNFAENHIYLIWWAKKF